MARCLGFCSAKWARILHVKSRSSNEQDAFLVTTMVTFYRNTNPVACEFVFFGVDTQATVFKSIPNANDALVSKKHH